MKPVVLPSLDELAARPELAANLPVEAARELYVRVHSLDGLLFLRMISSEEVPGVPENGERFLNAEEVGVLIGKSRSWVEKNTSALPKRRKVGGEGLWLKQEILRWMKHRDFWD